MAKLFYVEVYTIFHRSGRPGAAGAFVLAESREEAIKKICRPSDRLLKAHAATQDEINLLGGGRTRKQIIEDLKAEAKK